MSSPPRIMGNCCAPRRSRCRCRLRFLRLPLRSSFSRAREQPSCRTRRPHTQPWCVKRKTSRRTRRGSLSERSISNTRFVPNLSQSSQLSLFFFFFNCRRRDSEKKSKVKRKEGPPVSGVCEHVHYYYMTFFYDRFSYGEICVRERK